jgi:flavodoxin
MSKILVVVYSHTGTSRRLARVLVDLQRWSLGHVWETRPRSGLAGSVRCVMDSLLRRGPTVRYDGPNPGAFDAVVLVSPIWAGRLAGPMRSFVASHKDALRDVAVISVMGGRGASHAAAEVCRLIGRATLMEADFSSQDVDDGSFAARLEAFGKAVQQAEARQAVARPSAWSARAA